MYAKVVSAAGNHLFDVGDDVKFGSVIMDDPGDNVNPWADLIRIEANARCHFLEGPNPQRLDGPEGTGGVYMKWAWWWVRSTEETSSIECVRTDGEIFIMSNEGRTIERVT